MHKRVGMVAFALCIVILIALPGAVDELFAFFFVGLVPYTSYTIPPAAMLVIYAFLLAVGIYAIAKQLVTATSPVKREMDSRERARKKILRSSATSASPKTEFRTKKSLLSPVEQHTN